MTLLATNFKQVRSEFLSEVRVSGIVMKLANTYSCGQVRISNSNLIASNIIPENCSNLLMVKPEVCRHYESVNKQVGI
jgi:hypothetical protein